MDAAGQLDLNPPYQRRSVWNDAYRRFYIDTILRDYPSPAIYLEIETIPGSPTKYHVIDGKQRLETLIAFTKDEFHLAGYFNDEGYSDPYYSELSKEHREVFSEYVLSVENISGTTSEEIKSAFERLNRNTAKLNNQELRKAQFEGEFISKMTLLAENEFWSTLGLATRTRISRMLDVEYVSELYLLTMHGPQEGKAAIIDQYYALYDEEIPNEEPTDRTYNDALEWFSSVDLSGTRWKNLGDFYSLWGAIVNLITNEALPTPEIAETKLKQFSEQIAVPQTETERRYSDAVRQGTNKQASRITRIDIIERILNGKQ